MRLNGHFVAESPKRSGHSDRRGAVRSQARPLLLSSSGIDGFPTNNRKNDGPFCSLGGISSGVQSIAFDRKGNMIGPDYNSSTITVNGAPTKRQACGKVVGMIQDSFSQPTDAASLDAATGRIVVIANREVNVCSLRHGCTKRLNAPFLNLSASIALSHDGDCWAEADEASGPGVLYYFKGCNPICAPVSGPLPLVGNGTYVHLNKDSTGSAVADTQFSSIDVYKFKPTSLHFEYSFNGGLSGIEGVAYNPRAK